MSLIRDNIPILLAFAAGIYLLVNRSTNTIITAGQPTDGELRRNQLMTETRNSGYTPPPAGTKLTLAQEEEVVRFMFAFEGVDWNAVKVLTPKSVFDTLAFENILRLLEQGLAAYPSTLSPRPLEAALMLMFENRELLVARS